MRPSGKQPRTPHGGTATREGAHLEWSGPSLAPGTARTAQPRTTLESAPAHQPRPPPHTRPRIKLQRPARDTQHKRIPLHMSSAEPCEGQREAHDVLRATNDRHQPRGKFNTGTAYSHGTQPLNTTKAHCHRAQPCTRCGRHHLGIVPVNPLLNHDVVDRHRAWWDIFLHKTLSRPPPAPPHPRTPAPPHPRTPAPARRQTRTW